MAFSFSHPAGRALCGCVVMALLGTASTARAQWPLDKVTWPTSFDAGRAMLFPVKPPADVDGVACAHAQAGNTQLFYFVVATPPGFAMKEAVAGALKNGGFTRESSSEKTADLRRGGASSSGLWASTIRKHKTRVVILRTGPKVELFWQLWPTAIIRPDSPDWRELCRESNQIVEEAAN